MKNFTVIVLLFVNLIVGAMPFYNQNDTTLSKTEQQFEEISFSEIFTNKISKEAIILNSSKTLNIWFIKTFPSNSYLNKFEPPKIVFEACKYGYQVLFSAFLN